MNKPNFSLLVLIISNILLINLLSLVNSTLGSYGIFITMSGIFFFSATILLEGIRAIVALFITGLFLDVQMHTPFGFQAFAFIIFHILLKNWPFNVKPQENFHPVIIQVVCNSIIMIFCLVFSFFAYEEINFLRFCTDFFFSTLILIPLGIWNLNFFCDLFTVLRISSKISEQTI